MEIGNLNIFEGEDGTIEILGVNGWITILPENRRQLAEVLSKRNPRMKCVVCHKPSNYFICKNCQEKDEEQSAAKVRWEILFNGTKKKSGTTSRPKAYTIFTNTAYAANAKHWTGESYTDNQGNQWDIRFDKSLQKKKPEPAMVLESALA
jgi:hypothetical protein